MIKKSILTIIAVCISILAGCTSESQFSNPGGMWMPHQLTGQTETLNSLGVEDPAALSNPLAEPLAAVVSLGGCSASFVSPDGLIITNHHCAQGTLQNNSTPECNILENGFLAHSREEELPAEIGKKVWITQDIREITTEITGGLEDIDDPLERYEERENRIKTIIAKNEDASKGIRCSIRGYFSGQQYYLITQLELRDIRLVYAPDNGIGWYGGDIDNWHWPRHTGDFTFYRAYVAPDGSPAEYSKDNVPYHPKHYLRVADEPLCEGDFVMVAGYPGRTQRWQTAKQLRYAYETGTPRRIERLSDLAKIYERLAKQSDDLKIKTTPSYKGVMNYLQNLQLLQGNIKDYDILAIKDRQQEQFDAWIQADPARKEQWGSALAEIDQLISEEQKTDYADSLLGSLQSASMLSAAHSIVRMAEERPKPDEERDPSFQERNWDRRIQGQQRLQSRYDSKIDKALLRYYLNKIKTLPPKQKRPILTAVFNSNKPKDWTIKKLLNRLYSDQLTLEDADERVRLLQNASLEDLQASSDPIIKLALRIRPLTKALDDKGKIYSGKMALLMPQYVDAIKAFKNQPVAPDANGTLRVTYGTVKGYRPNPDAPIYEPFTKLTQVVEKHTGEEPFKCPQTLIDAVKDAHNSIFYVPELGDVPVNFLSDVDITGGNSGSATLNRKGELVGLVFDGNAESIASNWVFVSEITRGIHVDIRYVLWIMQNVDHADNLLEELNIF